MSTKTLLTADDLWKIVANGSRYELSRGELVPMTPVGIPHSVIVVRLAKLLSTYVDEKRLGVVGTEGGFKLHRNPDTLRAPDIAFISRKRLESEGIPKAFAEFPPDLAVEVLSPDDTASEMARKVDEYLSGGVPLIWVVDPSLWQVTVYRSLQDIKIHSAHEELDGGEILPGFRVKVADIFVLPF
jgi:Uma2 family endonuclease